MYKESWGLKRICPMCSKQYYDLGRTELKCPECEKEIEVTKTFKKVLSFAPNKFLNAILNNIKHFLFSFFCLLQ